LAVRLDWTEQPRRTNWRQMVGIGCLAGIGFTMSLFIANLALSGELLQLAKIAILGGSAVSGVAGWLLLRQSAPAAAAGKAPVAHRAPAPSTL
jgi:NhaA family Na+:H+ antiporter